MKLTSSTFFLGCLVGGMGAAVVPLLLTPSQAETKLLPFQGRLTDASGSAIPNGAKIVEFKMYDAPTGGTAKWAGEVHKLSVNGGLVNTMLGSKSSLGDVDFSTSTYLQITIDANNDNQITAADPPLLPRQIVQPAVYAAEAGNARNLNGHDWGVLFSDTSNGNSSTWRLKSEIIETGAITAGHLATNAVHSDEIADESIQKLDLDLPVQQSLVPPGSIIPFAGPVAPPGWHICDGSVIHRNKHKELFAAIGEAWGKGNGTSTFQLPDLRGQFIRGVTGSSSSDPDVRKRTPMGNGAKNGVGSFQDDRFQGFEYSRINKIEWRNPHSNIKLDTDRNVPEEGPSGFVYSAYGGGTGTGAGFRVQSAAAKPRNNGSHGNPRMSTESRPKNVYVNFIIKL